MILTTMRCFKAVLALTALGSLLLPAQAQPVPDGRAMLTVRLPASAVLTIDEGATRQTGPERTFISPPLPAGKSYRYTLTATWDDNGEQRNVTRKVVVRGGEHTQVDLTKADVAKVEDAKPKEKDPPKTAAKSRTFLFTYGTTVTGLSEGKTAKIWLPVPTSSEDQEVSIENDKGLPEGYKISKDKKTGNSYLFVDGKPNKDGEVPLSITYKVTRREVKGDAKEDGTTAEQLERFLEADKLVPIQGKPLELLKGKKLPKDQLAAAKVMYDVVNGHMKYDKPKDKPWGRGDSVYACDNGVGNCTDFHSLFITFARANKIPAKFEIGFSIPLNKGEGDIPGYHCWAKFKPEGKGWVPVDISEANKDPKMKEYYFGNLTEDRVTFSSGRDLELIPKQEGEPVNFLIYPYVEVDGKVYPGDKVKRKFEYKDVAE
ncbi:MAG: TIGR03000 domain-containing protein [Gemmataceae bacterium]|nr:TIGR03000 domain-containing protein [Gemmataceae bacterium]